MSNFLPEPIDPRAQKPTIGIQPIGARPQRPSPVNDIQPIDPRVQRPAPTNYLDPIQPRQMKAFYASPAPMAPLDQKLAYWAARAGARLPQQAEPTPAHLAPYSPVAAALAQALARSLGDVIQFHLGHGQYS